MTKRVGVALVGTGNIALLHTLGYNNFEGAEIRALCDLNAKRAQQFKEEASLPAKVKIYNDPTACFADEDIELVEILTPHATHEPLAVEAAEAGKHISVQKPPAMTLSSYDKMIHAAEKAGVRFRVYENFRYHPPYVKAAELIQRGTIGEVLSVNIRMWMVINAIGEYRGHKKRFPLHTLKWKIREKHNYHAPTLFDDGYHKHSLVEGYLGDLDGNSVNAVKVWCGWEKLFGLVKLDSPVIVIYETKKRNKYGTWNVNTAKDIPMHSSYFACDESLEITGSNGIIMAPGCTGNLFKGCECGGPGKPGTYWFTQDKEISEENAPPEIGSWKSDCSMETDWSQSFIDCTQHYATMIAEDRWFHEDDFRPLDGSRGRKVSQITLAIIRSLKEDGKTVKIKDVENAP